jgi:biopolymer transport protein ExbB
MKKLWLALLPAAFASLAAAGELDRLVRDIQETRAQERRLDEERASRFLADKNRQKQLLNDAKAALAKAEADSKALRAEFGANEAKLAELGAQLKTQSGELGVLFGAVREFAGAFKTDLENSLISAQWPNRGEALDALIRSKELPDIAQLENLWLGALLEMTESGKVVAFHGRLTDSAGAERETAIYRIGPFSAVAEGKYLRYAPETGQLLELPRQPAREYLSLARDFATVQGDFARVAIDPTRGQVFELAMHIPNAWERIDQGGVIGYIIIALGLAGLVIVVARLASLHRTGRKMLAQLADPAKRRDDNPLGRVLAVAGDCPDGNVEKLELQLDEAILRETPALERGLALLKLLIAVAPLLGLLGTVTGMIQVFQSITQYGSGDPRLMAGGIAEALVTTMLGLEVAIPLSFLYSLLNVRSRALVQILDEQSAGILSQSLERGEA